MDIPDKMIDRTCADLPASGASVDLHEMAEAIETMAYDLAVEIPMQEVVLLLYLAREIDSASDRLALL